MTDQMWLVTRGDYSDYRIICAAATEELADEICRRIGADDTEPVPLLTSADQSVEVVSYAARVWIQESGKLGEVYGDNWRQFTPPTGVVARVSGGANPQVYVEVSAKSPVAARHAVAEYATEIAAEVAAGVSMDDAVIGFHQRRQPAQERCSRTAG